MRTLPLILFLLAQSFSFSAQNAIISKNNLDKKWQQFSIQLDSCKKQGEWHEFLEIAEKKLAYAKKHYSKRHKNYHTTLDQVAYGLYRTQQKDKALALLRHTIKQIEQRVPLDTFLYAQHSFVLGDFLSDNLTIAMPIYENLIKKLENSQDSALIDYKCSCLYYCALWLSNRDIEIEKAISYVKKAADGFQKINELNGYALSLAQLSAFYRQHGEYNKGIKIAQKAIEIEPNDFSILSGLGHIYTDMKLYDKGLVFLEKALAISAKISTTNYDYALNLDNLSYTYGQAGQYQKGLDAALLALPIMEKTVGKKHSHYYLTLSHAATNHLKLKNNKETKVMIQEIEGYLDTIQDKKRQEFLYIMDNLAEIYQEFNDIPKAIKYYEMILDNSKDIWGKGEEHYVTPLQELILLYNQSGQSEKSLALARELAQNMNDYALSNFELLPEKYKEVFINNYAGKYLPILFSNLMHYKNKDPLSMSLTFDALLTMKGAVLQNTRRQNEAFIAQKDSVTQNYLNERRTLKQELAKLYSSRSTQNTTYNQDSIENALINVETKLLHRLPDFDQSLKSIRYAEVKKAMPKDTTSIEFVHFRYHNSQNWTDSVIYGAMIVQTNQEYPTFIPLFEEKSLSTLLKNALKPNLLYAIKGQKEGVKNKFFGNNNDTLSSARILYNLIWKPLEPHLKNTKVIYYAPSGLLNQVTFVALAANDTTWLSNQYVLNRVSSTREVVFEISKERIAEDKNQPKSIMLYGGIHYDVDSISLKKATKRSENDDVDDDLLIKISDKIKQERSTNQAWTYLEGTKKETDNIVSFFKSRKIQARLKSGSEATEDDFRTIGTHEDSPTILHLATHGFFYEKKQEDSTIRAFQQSINPLIRSGLVMAGANKIWLSGESYENMEDGILTAYEISQMNLSHTKLAVLSACETGLGIIQGTEGVYGLQRAFKMAGVDYILMSLWSIGDDETVDLMQEFYQNHLNGLSIRQAFNAAQETMKKNYNYTPAMWAGFVLMR